ncbi:putative MFS transporter [Eremomyces bilateralis CBS 781.70]|uniref:MFS transporter n=1 Tax=Eremomyces bilateralis CBS 781.70 TaxID=1392243 RepID=A0A6G1GHX6_9PEZI|nr:putative MFS transporter [Eremomyces bilateralis CBS 781.70]KAF1817470.1 putative MFS transporter [Eremomyces bilateralis CBS 781.70]
MPEKVIDNVKRVEDVSEKPTIVKDFSDKPAIIEDASENSLSLDKTEVEEGDVVVNLSEAEQKAAIRKVDWRVVPLLTFLYLVSFIDRSNIGNAKIAGMNDDLNLHGLQYNAAVTLFYVPYTLLEVPSNIVLKLMRPSLWISILLFTWGLVMTLMGLVESYQGLLAARWFLGVAEAGFFPAATYLLTIWYKRYEYQKRFAIFFSMASMAGAFSGLLAFAIEKMDGVGGRKGWQWIFILEGLVPIATSLVLWKILPDSPETATFLNKHEKRFVIERLATDTGSGEGRVTNNERIKKHHIYSAFKEWRVWAMILVYWGNSVGVYGFSATVPTVINELGYTQAQAQLLTVPIYFFAVILVLVFAFLSDHYQVRWIFIIIPYTIASCSFIAQLAIPHPRYPGVALGFLFGIAGGLYSGFPPTVAWVANNLAPSSKRAVAMALLISVGNMGAIAGSNVYLAREAPVYHLGFGACLAFLCVSIIMTVVLRLSYGRENARRDRLVEELGGEVGVKSRYSEQELLDMGDRSPFFRYAL